MKILMISPQPFFEPRGTPISIYQRLKGLSALGHQVHLATYPMGKDIALSGLSIRRISRVPMLKAVGVGPSWSKLLLDCLLFFKVFWMLLTEQYDVIHSHEEGAFIALIAARVFGKPHVYDMHSSLPQQLHNFRFGNVWPIVAVFEYLERRVVKTCDVVLTIGADLEAHVLALNPGANHVRIENTLSDASIPANERQVSQLKAALGIHGRLPVVYTGTLERYQGLDLLLASAKLVVQQQPNVVFIIVGGNRKQIAHWECKATGLGLQDHVRFVGSVPLEEVFTYLELAAILVSPRTAGLSVPLKIYSYLQSGKPIVATQIYAHTQLLMEVFAVVVEALPEAYAHGILQLVVDTDLRHRLGQNAQSFAHREFSQASYIAKLEKAYLLIAQVKPIDEIAMPLEDNREVQQNADG